MNQKLVIVCIEDHPKAIVLLRLARNRARAIEGKWRAVFVETPAYFKRTVPSSQERVLRLLTLAEQMGGETAHVEAETVEKGIAKVLEAEKGNIGSLIVGNTESASRFKIWRSSMNGRIASLARRQHIKVDVVPLSGQYYRRSWGELIRWSHLFEVVYALCAVAVAYGAALLLKEILPPALFRINNQNIGLLFMTSCAFAAGRFGLLPGLVASIASSLTINYFFTPSHTVNVMSEPDVLNMAIFLLAAVLISIFTSQTRGYAEKAAKRELSAELLFTLYRTASIASSRQEALVAIQEKLAQMLKMDVAFFVPTSLNPERVELAYPAGVVLKEPDYEALNLCWSEVKTTGFASPFNPGTKWRFEAMLAPGGEMGVLGVRPNAKTKLDVWFGRLLSAVANQSAAIIEHIELEHLMEVSHVHEEREKLRSMLLSSVSHDLKTPLASIIGALSIYRSQNKRLTQDKRESLIDTALQESERLDNFISNILTMTRLESDKIEFKQDWHDISRIIHQVIRRLDQRLRDHKITLDDSLKGTEVYMDSVMTEQVIQNVIDNACKYTPAGTAIDIEWKKNSNEGFFLEVRDYGAGLPEEKMDSVFDKYARLQKEDSQVAGTGLGLAISKAIMEAQGGAITAANHPEGGATFTLRFAQWRKATHTKYVA